MPDTNLSIILVKDQDSVRTSLQQILIMPGNRRRRCTDGHMALIGIRKRTSGVLLSNLTMAVMSRFELL